MPIKKEGRRGARRTKNRTKQPHPNTAVDVPTPSSCSNLDPCSHLLRVGCLLRVEVTGDIVMVVGSHLKHNNAAAINRNMRMLTGQRRQEAETVVTLSNTTGGGVALCQPGKA